MRMILENTCDPNFRIVQGDTCQLVIEMDIENPLEIIEKVWMSSSALGIQEEAIWNEEIERFVVTLNADVTATFSAIRATYDITVKFYNQKVKTSIFEGILLVQRKVNKIEA